MVKTTWKTDYSWSAIFSVIVYCCYLYRFDITLDSISYQLIQPIILSETVPKIILWKFHTDFGKFHSEPSETLPRICEEKFKKSSKHYMDQLKLTTPNQFDLKMFFM